MNPTLIILICLSALSLIILTASYITYRMTFYRPKGKKYTSPDEGLEKDGYSQFRDVSLTLIDEFLKIPYEDVYITSHDGLRLHGKYYHRGDTRPVAIQCHGYKSTPSRDFSGGAVMTMEMGFNVLLIEQRAHESSDGHTIAFGDYERYDLLKWIEYVRGRFGEKTKIMLYGMSMGAATVILASALDLGDGVLGAVADCPYSSAAEIIKNTIRQMGLPPTPLYPLVRLGGIIFGKTDPERANVEAAAAAHKIPIMIIHGEGDSFVPCDMSRKIYARLSDDPLCSLNTFADAEHGISYLHDTERYISLVREFCTRLGAFDA